MRILRHVFSSFNTVKGGLILTLLFISLSFPSTASAIGILYAGVGGGGEAFQPLRVKSLRADIRIVDQVAITKVDQVFANDSEWVLEGIYIFPLPERATATEFALWIDGVRVVADVKEREQARREYDAIVRRRIDPALLEYLGGNVFKASVFPIPAKGERRIEIEYAELLTYDRGEIGYTFPLRAEGLMPQPLESVILSISILSQSPIADVISLSYPELTEIERKSAEEVSVLFGDEHILPKADFRLAIRVTPGSIGLSLLTYNPPDSLKEDGYYIFWVTPPEDAGAAEVIPKDIVFTVDVSSSMEGEKMLQTKAALRRSIDLLAPGDRFNIIPFSTDARQFRDDLVPASDENKAEAKRFVDGLRALGLTNIEKGISLAIGQQFSESSARMIVFLTDGEPTYGETDPDSILKIVKRENAGKVRIFTIGVGKEIDRGLVVRMARENGGYPVFIERDEEIEGIISDFFDRISRPVLTNIALDFGGLKTYDTYPVEIPDLFIGSRLFQVGRYSDARSVEIVLSGRIGGRSVEYRYPAEFSRTEGGYSFISRVWASEKITNLLEQIALLGEQTELVEAVKTLGLKYQIVTPYTSLLVLEPGTPPVTPPVVMRDQEGDGDIDFSSTAVEDATWTLGEKTFSFQDGIWTDAAFRPGMRIVNVSLDGREVADLLQLQPELGRYLTTGRDLLVVLSDGVAYRIEAHAKTSRAFLGHNTPNPFNPETTIPYIVITGEAEQATGVTLTIYNILGQKVRTLIDHHHGAGSYSVTWGGRDEHGISVPTGVYFAVLHAGGQRDVLRMTLMK